MMRQSYQSASYRSSYRHSYTNQGSDSAGSGEVSHERWLVSYADFMTLLMAFFVVMYSISQISEDKYRVLSETLTQAFNPANQAEQILQEGDPQLSHTLTPIDMDGLALEDRPGNDANDVPETFVRIEEQLKQSFQSLIENDLITVKGDERWLQIELQSAILFNSGGAVLSDTASAIIGELTAALSEHSNVIRVEGFTDNVPIATTRFNSNWELSTARATAVVKLMESQGIESRRMAAIGYGEHQPVASNRTEEGRARNRRIVLMVSTSEQLRPDVAEQDELILNPEVDLPAIGLTDQGVPIRGLGESARAEAQAWFERLNAREGLVGAQSLAPEITASENASAESAAADKSVIENPSPENTATNNNESASKVERSTAPFTAEGIKQLQLENGALLFTNEEPTE